MQNDIKFEETTEQKPCDMTQRTTHIQYILQASEPISRGVQSDGWPTLKGPMHCTHASRLPPGDLRKQWGILVFLHAPPKGWSDAYRQNPTLIAEPL